MYNKTYPTPPQDEEKALEAAYKVSLYILSYRDNTESMLRQKLRLRHYKQNTVDDVIERLKNEGAIDDERMARVYANELATVKRYGQRRIKAELFSRGFSTEVVENVSLDEYDFDENCRIRLEKLGKNYDKKTVNALLRYGFDYSTIKRAYEDLCK